jgi:cleavage and polyadenylation specificity factor subunit 4
MYKLGFCVYGPKCRFRHTKLPGPPPDPEVFEAAKPREFRDVNIIVNGGVRAPGAKEQRADRQAMPTRPPAQ